MNAKYASASSGVNVLPMFIRMTCSFKTNWVNGAKSLSDSILLKTIRFCNY